MSQQACSDPTEGKKGEPLKAEFSEEMAQVSGQMESEERSARSTRSQEGASQWGLG